MEFTLSRFKVNRELIPKESADHLAPFSVFPEEETDGGSDESLKYFKGEFQHGVFPGAVYVGLTQGVSRDSDKGAKDGRAKNDRGVVSSIPAHDKGHDDGADTVGGKGDEHGEGIEKEIPEERAHTADKKCAQGVERQGGNDNDDIIQVNMPAGDRDAERRENSIYCHEQSA